MTHGPADPLLFRATPPGGEGLVNAADPASVGWRYLGVSSWRLAPGRSVAAAAEDRERVVLVLEGRARIVAGDLDLGEMGSRMSVFDGPPPPVVLVEPGRPVSVTATTAAWVVVGEAPAGPIARTAATPAEDILVEDRGSGSARRRIHHLLPPDADAGRLIAFETFTPGGNWSSWPPHKHDTEDPPTEAYLEELYIYRFARPRGFAFMRVYTADRTLDRAMTPGDGDIVAVPRGYHPVGMPAGYDGYYVSLMAGHHRAWNFTTDPDHAWLMDWDPRTPQAPATGR